MRSGIVSNTENQLEASSDLNEGRAKGCGWLVVGGLVLEVVLTAEFPAHAPKETSWYLAFIETWGPVFADVLVAIGVWGEIFFSGKVRKVENELRRLSNEKVAAATEAAAEANKAAARAAERTAGLEKEAAILRVQLDQEIQKRTQRFLSDEQRTAMIAELRGKLKEIAVVTQNDIEANAFAMQLITVFSEAGVGICWLDPPRADKWFAPAGLLMYSPLGANEDQLGDDPLYRALKAAKLFGGTTSRPFLSPQIQGQIAAPLIEGYRGNVLYVGQKSPF